MVGKEGIEDAPDHSRVRKEKACEVHLEYQGEEHGYIFPERAKKNGRLLSHLE